MKIYKKISILFALFIVVILGIIFLSPIQYCNISLDGGSGISESIDESKKINVFIAKYKPEKATLQVDKKSILKIKEAWLEYSWTYTKDIRYPIIEDSSKYNFVIITLNRSQTFYLKDWWLNKFYPIYPENKDNSLIYRKFGVTEINDTMNFIIQGYNPKNGLLNDTIGQLLFFKMN